MARVHDKALMELNENICLSLKPWFSVSFKLDSFRYDLTLEIALSTRFSIRSILNSLFSPRRIEN